MADDDAAADPVDFRGVVRSGGGPNLGGRPRGSKNKRSLDLARYVAAQFGGMTPGQQAAAMCLVSPREVREAPEAARQLKILDLGLAPVVLAMVVKAQRLAVAIRCDVKDAWLLMAREREGLMAYVHQKQPQAADREAAALPVAFMVPEGDERAGPLLTLLDDDAIDNIREIPGAPGEVTNAKSPT